MRVYKTMGKDGIYVFLLVEYETREGVKYKIFGEKYGYNGINEKWRVGQNLNEETAKKIIDELIANA